MATNNKTMQINTFGKGMNTDISDSLLDNESYRLAKNLRIVTDTEENSGELRLIEGATEIKNLLKDENPEDYDILAATQIRNYGLIITKNKYTTSPNKFNDDDDLFLSYYKYFIVWHIEQLLYLDPLTLEPSYSSTLVCKIYYGRADTPEEAVALLYPEDSVSWTHALGHLPTVHLEYKTVENETKTKDFDLNDNVTWLLETDPELFATEATLTAPNEAENLPEGIFGIYYETIEDQDYNLNIQLVDGLTVEPGDEIPEPQLDMNAITLAWCVDNYKNDDFYDPFLFAVALVGTPSQNRLPDDTALNETYKTKLLARYLPVSELYLAFTRNWNNEIEMKYIPIGESQGYIGLMGGGQICPNTEIPIEDESDPRYPKDIWLCWAGSPDIPPKKIIGDAEVRRRNIDSYRKHDDEGYYYQYSENGLRIYPVLYDPITTDLHKGSSKARRRSQRRGDQQLEEKYTWSVWRFNNDTDELDRILTCYTPIGFNFENKPSLTTYWEDDDNIKLYIADGEHGILVVNVALPLGEYKGLTKLSTLSSVVPPPITDITKTDGLLAPAYVQYAYRMYNKHGVASKLSILSKLKSIDNGDKGIPDGKLSNVGYSLKLPYDKTDFDRVLIYRISYRQLGQLPTIDLIIDEKYEWQHPYVDTGRTTLQTITIEEFNSLSGVEIVPREIESKDNFLFASNIKYRTSEYIDAIKEWKSEAMTSDMKYDISNRDTWIFDVWGFGYTESNTNVNWEYIVNQDDISGQNVVTYENDTLRKSRTLRRGEVYRYGIVLYMDDGYVSQPMWIADIRTPMITSDIPNIIEQYLDQGQTDKAVLLYNMTHPYYSHDGRPTNILANNLGIRFTINNLPEGCVGYEIVRCNRTIADKHTITQVVLSNTFHGNDDDATKHMRMPTGLITTDKVIFYAKDANYLKHNSDTNDYYIDLEEKDDSGTDEQSGVEWKSITEVLINEPGIYLAISPEIVYLPDDVLSIFDSYNEIKILPIFKIFPGEDMIGYENIADTNAAIVSLANKKDSIPYLLPDQNENTLVIYAGRYYPMLNNRPGQYMPYFHGTLAKAYHDNLYDTGIQETDEDVEQHNYRAVEHSYMYIIGTPFNKDYNSSKIDDYSFAKVDRWNGFADDSGNFKFEDSQIQVSGESYVNWVMPAYLLNYNTKVENRISYITRGLNDSPRSIVRNFRIDIGGRCAVINTLNTSIRNHWEDNEFAVKSNVNGLFSTLVCNITKQTTPYGGLSTANDSVYYSFGNYNSSDNSTIDVYDGDTFIRVLQYTATHDWEHNKYKYHMGCTTVYHIPFETDIDMDKDNGDKWSRALSSYIQDQPSDVMGKYIQKNPEYAYNTAYSSQSQARLFSSSDDYYERMNDVYDYRVHYSNPKSTNELIDSYTVFQPLNYLDVDTRYGEITELRTFLNNLLYWLNNAVGLLSVNERVQLADESNLPLILGTGGVLARYDYLSTRNGMKENLFADTQSDTVLYWWDYDRHEICAYSGGTQVVPLSKSKFIQNMLNSASKKGELTLNPHLAFDKPYNEVLFTITDGYSVIYNEYLQYFSAIYDTAPFASLAFTDRIIFLPAYLLLYVWNKSNGLTSWSIEDERLLPYLKYVVNDSSTYTKVYDNSEFGGRMYGGEMYALLNLSFRFATPLKQEGRLEGDLITNRQYEFEFAVPRSGELINMLIPIGGHGQFVTIESWKTSKYGDRLRGKTMQCEMSSTSNSLDFSLQYIITKYRISWS